jgi:hypothetical protein
MKITEIFLLRETLFLVKDWDAFQTVMRSFLKNLKR